MSSLPVNAPPITGETERFWRSAASGDLELPVCDACARVIWYPRAFCPHCGSRDVTWSLLSGGGRIYSYSVIRRAPHPDYSADLPYCLAMVDLDEGVRLMSNVISDDLDTLAVGQRVRAIFDRVDDGYAILRFRPSGEG